MNKKEELLALIHGNGYRGMHAAQLSRALDMEDSASFTQLIWKQSIYSQETPRSVISQVKSWGMLQVHYASIRKASALWKQRIPAII